MMVTQKKYVAELEQHMLEIADSLKKTNFYGRPPDEDDKKCYSMWESDCDKCID